MKKLLLYFAVVLGVAGFFVNAIAAEKKVYKNFTVPVDKNAQAARIDVSQLQAYFKKRHLQFAMIDNLYENNIVLAVHATRKLMVTDPLTKQKVGHITIRFSQSTLRVYCAMITPESAVCDNLEATHTEFLSTPKDGVVEIASLMVGHPPQ